MKFEIGKMYKTRDGRKALVFMPDNGAGHMYGAVSDDRGCWNVHSWYSSGEAHYDERGLEHKKYDLISEWTEPKKPRMLAPCFYKSTMAGVKLSYCLYESEEQARTNCLNFISWPAVANAEGFYEVPT